MTEMHRYFLKLSYNGAAFSGWQFQPAVPTVQGELERALSAMLHEKITVIGCGRTDAGVHASKYFAHIDSRNANLHQDAQFLFRLNKTLPAGVAVQKVYLMHDNAHARFSALSRSYRYVITRVKNPFETDLVWVHPDEFDVEKMNEAAAMLIGDMNFVAFSKTGNTTNTTICNVTEAIWQYEGDKLIFKISANRFLRNMVRAIVATLVETGKGNFPVERACEILHSRQQPVTSFTVPANGLYLCDIRYPERFNLD